MSYETYPSFKNWGLCPQVLRCVFSAWYSADQAIQCHGMVTEHDSCNVRRKLCSNEIDTQNKNCKPEILKFRDLQRLSDHWLGSSLGVQPTYVFHSFTFTSCIRKTKNKLIIFLKCKKFFSLSQNLNIVLTISSIDTTNQIWSKSVMCIEKSDMETGRWIVEILRGT